MDIVQAIKQRRTHKVYTGAPIGDDVLAELLDCARWAPNHKFTEPWRFVVVRGAKRQEMATTVVAALESMRKPDAASDRKLQTKQNKIRRRMNECGAVIVASYITSPDDALQDREDYAATACAVHNMQLAATSFGLACLWSTSKALDNDRVRQFLELSGSERIVAVLFVGHPTCELAGHRARSVADVTRWL